MGITVNLVIIAESMGRGIFGTIGSGEDQYGWRNHHGI